MLETASLLSNSQPSLHASVGHEVFKVSSKVTISVRLTEKMRHFEYELLVLGMNRFRRCSLVRLKMSGVLHQWSGVSVMKSWLKAQNPHGKHAGRQTNQSISF
jgi:hypothetical protein